MLSAFHIVVGVVLAISVAAGGVVGDSGTQCATHCAAGSTAASQPGPEARAESRCGEVRWAPEPNEVFSESGMRARSHPRAVTPATPPTALTVRDPIVDDRAAHERPPSSGRDIHLRLGVMRI